MQTTTAEVLEVFAEESRRGREHVVSGWLVYGCLPVGDGVRVVNRYGRGVQDDRLGWNSHSGIWLRGRRVEKPKYSPEERLERDRASKRRYAAERRARMTPEERERERVRKREAKRRAAEQRRQGATAA